MDGSRARWPPWRTKIVTPEENTGRRSMRDRVGVAAVIMMASVLLSRVIGLLREMVVAYVGGASGAVDAYQLAFLVPEILNHVVASGFLSITFIPLFSRYLAEDDEAEGWRVLSLLLTMVGSLLVGLILLASVLAPQLVDLVAHGRPDPAFRAAVIRMTRIIMPAQLFFFAGGLLMAVQFAKERFAIPALAPLLYNGGIILCGIVLGPVLGMEGFSWGVLAGAVVGNFASISVGNSVGRHALSRSTSRRGTARRVWKSAFLHLESWN